MPELTVSFLGTLRQSQLLTAEQIDSVVESPPAPANDAELAQRFLQAGLLTQFQVDLLQKGRHKGFILKGKYKILDLIGAGGMGRVFRCEHMHLHRQVAVKLLSIEQARDPSNVERFYREARAVAALDDPNIVRVYDVERDEKMPAMIMEYVDGTSLHDLVDQAGPRPVAEAANFVAQAALGLQHAHEVGIVHRDIKPGNLLLDRKGVVKILDMGLARFSEQSKNQSLTERFDSNSVLGTADYLAPEQAVNSSTVDIRADLYALGGTLYYLLTGKAPFDAPTIAEKLLAHQMRPVPPLNRVRSNVPAGLEAIYQKLMSKNPDDRYATPEALLDALAPFADPTRPMRVDFDLRDTVPARQDPKTTARSSHRRHHPPATPPAAPATRPRRMLWIAGVAAGLVVAGAVLALVLPGGGGSSSAGKPAPVEVPQASVPPGAEAVAPENASQYIGKQARVELVVARAGYDKKGATLFLNSMEDYRNPRCFTVILYRDVAGKLYPETEFEKLDERFAGKKIRVQGVIKSYQGRAEIILESGGQLELLN